jgi:hypothetical protein
MANTTALRNANEALFYEIADMRDKLIAQFQAGKPLHWQTVPKQLIHRVWLSFSKTGHVQDERALDNILQIMRECLARLTCATIVAEHTEWDRSDFLDGGLPAAEHEAFTDWLIEDSTSGYWRISDYGLKPLNKHIASAQRTKPPDYPQKGRVTPAFVK